MSNNNLWQVSKFDDLLYWIKQSKDKCIFLSVVLDNSKIIKKFMKDLALIYKNSLFLYWVANEKELSRMSVLPTDTSKYPYVVCIHNINDLLCEVNNVESIETLNLCFNEVKKFFILDEKKIQNNSSSSSSKSPSIKTELSQVQVGNEIRNGQGNAQTQVLAPVQTPNSTPNPTKTNPVVKTPADIINEKKRHLDKLIYLKDKFDEYQIDFFKDIQKRKKDEEKLRNKNKTN